MIGIVAVGVIGVGVAWHMGPTHSKRVGGSIVSAGVAAVLLVIAQSC